MAVNLLKHGLIMSNQPPQEYAALNEAISANYPNLSKRLKQIAGFALEHPTTMGIETIAHIAQSANVQPSALIRFAKAFRFSGFSDMQRVFQRHVTEQSASYKERIARELAATHNAGPDSIQTLLRQYCQANIVALEHLQKGMDSGHLNQAIAMLKRAQHIYVIGQRRSLPVATYLTYTLSHADCRVHLIDGSGGLLQEQARAMRTADVLVAISFHPYSSDTTEVVTIAAAKRIPCIAISDSSISPVADKADICFSVHDAEVHNFRSLSASMLLAQTLATSLAFDYEKQRRK